MNKKMFWMGLLLIILGSLISLAVYGLLYLVGGVVFVTIGASMTWIGIIVGIVGAVFFFFSFFAPDQKEYCFPWQKCFHQK